MFWISITFSIKYVLIFTAFLFSGLLVYYSFLTLAGLVHRSRKRKDRTLEHYPSVDILIPAHNEGVVIKDTLEAMAKIEYPGKLTVYLLNDNSQDETPEIGDDFDKAYAHIRHIRVPLVNQRKITCIKLWFSISDGEYFCVYDADNQPEPHALRMLVEHAETTEDAVGAVGHVRTVNEKKLANTNDFVRISNLPAPYAIRTLVTIPNRFTNRNKHASSSRCIRRAWRL